MNRFLFVRLAVCTGLFFLASQTQAQKFRLGVRAMPQLSAIWNAEDADSDTLIRQSTSGIGLGVSVSYLVQPKWEVELNVLFSSQGQRYQIRDTTAARLFRRYDLNLTYIKIPVLLKYRTPLDESTTLAVYAGPQIQLLAGASEVISDTITVDYSGTGISTSNKYTGINYSAVIGAELQFAINEKLIFYTGVRAEYGFRDVENKSVTWAQDGFAETPYYDNFYGPSYPRATPRTEKSTNFVIGATVGISYILNTTRNPNDYYW